DTIWGLGCDATNQDAVKKLYSIKQRDDRKAMLVLIDSIDYLEYYVEDVPEIAADLIEVSEKPLTIIYSGAKNMASNLIAPDGTIGIRITRENFSNSLCKCLRRPVVATSANISNAPSPASFSEIQKEIIDSVDYVVNYRQEENTKNKASSIIKLNKNGVVTIIRP
ncbi:MAG: threonylcarbamoyl-AMP synthase, partial [Dysgonamonadaceae bacterium]|nr:threonylcarbamoyl-AMP synthase [Dysgonamonadaceae bacterium]